MFAEYLWGGGGGWERGTQIQAWIPGKSLKSDTIKNHQLWELVETKRADEIIIALTQLLAVTQVIWEPLNNREEHFCQKVETNPKIPEPQPFEFSSYALGKSCTTDIFCLVDPIFRAQNPQFRFKDQMASDLCLVSECFISSII